MPGCIGLVVLCMHVSVCVSLLCEIRLACMELRI